MNITQITSFLPHAGADAALGFYRDILGFEVRQDVGEGDRMRWITIVPPGLTGAAIVLHPPEANPGLTDGERRVVAELMAKGLYGAVNFATPDLDGLFAAVAAAGAEVMEEPTDQPWGVRDCAFRDPAGNMVRVSAAG